MILCLGTTPTLARTMRFRRLTLDAVNRTASVVEYASGKSINAARAIKTAGGRALCLGVLGGPRGQVVRRMLDDAFIAHDMVEVTAPTRLCITVIDDATTTATELVEESSALTSADGENVLATLRKQLETEPAGALVLSGSVAAGLSGDFYARCVDLAADYGLITVVDASGPSLTAALEMTPGVAKLNALEFCQTFSIEPADEEELVSRIREVARTTGVWFVVTRGGGVTIASDGDHVLKLASPAVDVVSAIGSGDVLAGVLAGELLAKKPIDEGLRWAIACAAANVSTPHAAHFEVAVATRLLDQIDVTCR
jgi:1-phosphofructokinase family hexose kinase